MMRCNAGRTSEAKLKLKVVSFQPTVDEFVLFQFCFSSMDNISRNIYAKIYSKKLVGQPETTV